MVQVSLATTTTFSGNLNALVEDQGTSLTFEFSLDEPAPTGGLRLYVDSDVEQIINRLDLPGFAFNPRLENIDVQLVSTNFDNSGFALTLNEGATTGSFTIDIFNNPEPDTFLPTTFDGLVAAEFSLKTADQVADEDLSSITNLSDYTISAAAGTTTVLFVDSADQLPTDPTIPPVNGYDEAVGGDISSNPTDPLVLTLAEGETRLSASTGGGDQEYITVTVPEGLQLESLVLESYSPNDVGFIGVQEGTTFTEPLDDSAVRENILGYTLFGTPRQIGTDILDEIGNGLNAQGFNGPLPSGDYTFVLQQLGSESDYTLAFSVSEATVELPTEPGDPIVSVALIGGTFDAEGSLAFPYLVEAEAAGSPILSLIIQSDASVPAEGLVVNINTDLADITTFLEGTNFLPTAFGGEVLGAIYNDEGTATGLTVRLDNPNAVVNFTNGLGLEASGPQVVSFFVEAGEGYTPDADAATITVYDSVDQLPTPTTLPEIGISIEQSSALVEGDGDITLNFTVDGEIPPEGVLTYVSTGEFAGLVDFDLLNAGVVGGPFPTPDGNAGGFYFKLTEPTASLTLQAREDEEVEGLESIDISLQPLAGYTIADGGQDVSILLGDRADSQIQVSLEVEPTVLIESEETVSVHTFSLSSAPPVEGITVAVDAPALSQFDLDAIALQGATIAAVRTNELDQPIGFDLTITEQTAIVSLPVEDQRAFSTRLEGSDTTQTVAFVLADPAADANYQVNPEANSGTFTIVETPEDAPVPALEGEESNDTIATATDTSLTADNATVTINGEISGNFFDADLSLRTDQTEDVDLYKVELAAGDVLRIDTDANQNGSELDTVLRLFDAEGNALAQSDDNAAPDELFNSSIGFDSYLEYTADAAGEYYVGVSSFSNGEFDFITNAYDPNVVASGSGDSHGDYTLNLSLNQESTVEPTVIADGDGTGPVVSFTAIPGTFDGDAIITNALVQSVVSDDDSDIASVLTLQLSAEGEIPEGGVEIFLNSNVDLSERFDTGFGRGVEVLGAIYDETGTPTGLRISLTATSALLNLNVESPETLPTDGTETLELSLIPSAGYQATERLVSLPIYDTLADVPPSATLPSVSIAASETALVESTGNTTTLTFNLSEVPPAEGILIYVDSEIEGALSEFNVFDAEITGADSPFPNGDASGFYLRMTEQTATVTVSAFDETTNPQLTPEDALEGIESLMFSIEDGAGYTVAPDNSAVELTIADNPDSVVIPDTGGNGGEEPPENPENEFNDTISTAIVTGLSTENPAYENLATLEVTDITLNPDASDEEQLFYANLVDSTEDVDMYAFTLKAGQTITLDVDAGGTGDAGVEGSTLDSILRVFDAAGNEVAISENDGAPDEVFQANGDTYLEFTASESGTYYAGISVLGNSFYDPNVQGSGSGWIFEERFEPGEYRLSATLGDGTNGGGGDLPVLSLAAMPEILNEAENTILTYNFSVDGEIPEGGLVFHSEDLFSAELDWPSFDFDNPDPAELSGLEIVDFERVVADNGNATFLVNWRMLENEGFLKLPVVDDEVADAPGNSFTVGLLPGEGYKLSPSASEVTVGVEDGIDNTGGPVVSMNVNTTALNEGDLLTLSFTAEGDIPEGGQKIFVSSDVQNALGEFVTVGEDGGPILTTTGFSNLEPTFSGFIATMTENTASISLNVFDDGPGEGAETFSYTLLDGETYDVDTGNNSFTITVNDTPTDTPIVSFSLDPDVVSEEDANPVIRTTFTVEGEIPTPEFDADGNLISGGLSVLYQGPLNEIFQQIAGDPITTTILPGPFFDQARNIFEFILLDNVATADITILNDVIQEGEQVFTFSAIENDGSIDSTYVVNPESSTDSVTITDGNGGPGVVPTVDISITETDLAEGDSFTVNFNVDGEVSADNPLTVLVDSETFGALGEFNIFDVDGNPAFTTSGIDGVPVVGDTGASSFLVNLIDPNASIALSVFDDGPNEGSETLTFELVDGEEYDVGSSSSITLTLNDFEMVGTDAAETLVGDDGDNSLAGLGGNDTIAGGLANDIIFGGDGDDMLRGDGNSRNFQGGVGGNDIIFGGEGSDRIGGKAGNDTLIGDAGNDMIWGDSGDDIIMGSAGNDILIGDNRSGNSGRDLFVFGNGDGTDTILDFEITRDQIGLIEDELSFTDIMLTQDDGNTLLGVASSGETLAILQGVQAFNLGENSFVLTPDISTPEETTGLI